MSTKSGVLAEDGYSTPLFWTSERDGYLDIKATLDGIHLSLQE